MALPSLASLEALEAIARAGSVTRAASTLHLTQSAISHRVRGLERDTGLQLLEHVGRGVRLTAAGLRLARAAAEARQLLEDTVASLAREPGREVLSISCSPSFAIRFLVPRLAKFHAAHPELDLRVAADQGTIDPLRAGADALVVLRAGPAPGAFSEKLCEELVFPVVSPRLLERGPALRTAADLRRHTLLHDEALAEAPERVGWQSWLASAGEPLLRAPSIRFSHAYLAIEAALVGDGVALARRSLVAEDLARGRLVAPLEPSVPSGLAYWLITAQDPARRAPLTALRSFLRGALRDAQRLADRARARRRKKIGITVRREAGKARGEI
ncbi:MAG TPA: LysR substrate-binding domain-containing protein [Polyangiales bacterium]|nr:LysR substrate-binding domain-containing protein [Polyangiales bacterium]